MFSFKKSIGALIGNTMQFYDFTIYAFLVPQLSQEFFNFKNTFLSYLVAVSVFAGGYFTRPIGALLFGQLGDRKGRSKALSKTIILTSISTFLIGVIPSYTSIGFVASLTLVILRLIQGLAVSGEEGGAAVLLFEKYSFKNRGVIGSLVLSSVLAGVVLGMIVCASVIYLIDNNYIGHWGWRLPFLLSLPFGVIAIMLRFSINDFKLFNLAKKNEMVANHPIKALFKSHSPTILFGVNIVAIYSIATSTLIVHIPFYLNTKLGFSRGISLAILAVAISFISVLTIFFGKLCDKISSSAIYIAAQISVILFSPILFYMLSLGHFSTVIFSIMGFSIITALISSAIFSILVESFPFGIRYSGVSLSFNLSVTIFSSSTPVVLLLIEQYCKFSYAPGMYISALSMASLLFMFYLKNKIGSKSLSFKMSEATIYQQ